MLQFKFILSRITFSFNTAMLNETLGEIPSVLCYERVGAPPRISHEDGCYNFLLFNLLNEMTMLHLKEYYH